MERSRVTRWAAPAAFLAAITIGAVVVRAGFDRGNRPATTPTTTLTSTKKSHGHGHRKQHLKTYTVQTGDTLEGIATKTGTTVTQLEKLNPGVNPTALRVGERIRVQ